MFSVFTFCICHNSFESGLLNQGLQEDWWWFWGLQRVWKECKRQLSLYHNNLKGSRKPRLLGPIVYRTQQCFWGRPSVDQDPKYPALSGSVVTDWPLMKAITNQTGYCLLQQGDMMFSNKVASERIPITQFGLIHSYGEWDYIPFQYHSHIIMNFTLCA